MSKISKSAFLFFLKELRIFRGWVVATLMLSIGVAFLANLMPKFFQWAVDDWLLHRSVQSFAFWGLWLLGLEFTRWVVAVSNQRLLGLLTIRFLSRLRQQLFAKVLGSELSELERIESGRLFTRTHSDWLNLVDFFQMGIFSLVLNVAIVGFLLVHFFWIDPATAWGIVLLVAVVLALAIFFSQKLKFYFTGQREKIAALNGWISESLIGLKVFQSLDRTDLLLGEFERRNLEYRNAQLGSVTTYAVFQPLITVCTGLAMAWVIGWGGYRVDQGHITLGQWTALLFYVLALFQPIFEFADRWNVFLGGLASLDRIRALLEDHTQLLVPTVPASSRAPLIRFQGVDFAYGPGALVLKGFDLEIPFGSKLGIRGRTGSGKSSLVHLLLGLYEPQVGSVQVGGLHPRQIDSKTFARWIGWVPQETLLMAGTLEDNLWAGLDEAALLRAQRRWSLLVRGEVVMPAVIAHWARHGGIRIEERGKGLSAGERQLVAILRAWVRDPLIWVLDEATSALDAATEAEVVRFVTTGGEAYKTHIVIAHRPAAFQGLRRVLHLRSGVWIDEEVKSGNPPEPHTSG